MPFAENLHDAFLGSDESGDLNPCKGRANDEARRTRACDRVRESLAVLAAINAGELLSALPDCDAARNRHETAVSLLAAMELLLRDAAAQLED